MTTTSFKMNRHSIATFLLTISITVLLFSSCKKNDNPHGIPASAYSSDVLDKWITLQLRLMKNTTGVPNQAFSRHYAYTGIAALESIAPGLSANALVYRKWNGLTSLPTPAPFTDYYYPANVNAAMAAINKAFFPNASAVDKGAIDSLETALNELFLANQPGNRITKSSEFGKAVAAAVFNWAESDGFKNANNPYTVPVGPGLWKPTPPTPAAPATPYWGNNRTVVTGSIDNVNPGAPTSYSTDEVSPFFTMAKYIYDVSQSLTDEQKAIAIFWRDVPGVSSPGHWLSIQQVAMKKTYAKLDKAALAYALTGAAINDALISGWKVKYQYNLLRPITYIREVMGHSAWSSYIGTPSHPEYSSAHSVLSGAAAAALQKVFGSIGSFTDHTYDYMGLAPRTYYSFTAAASEAGMSRVYGGIHYKNTVDASLLQGKKVADNIFKKPDHQD